MNSVPRRIASTLLILILLWLAGVFPALAQSPETEPVQVDWQELSSGKSLKESHPQLFMVRGFLSYDVAPGEEALISMTIKTPDVPGKYLIQFNMVSELIQWFSDQESQLFTTNIILK